MKEKIMFWWKCDDFMEKFKEPIFEVFCKTKGENGFPLHFPDDLLKESDFLITAHNKKDKIIGYMLISMSFENSIFSEKRKTFLTEIQQPTTKVVGLRSPSRENNQVE